jgi:hypothetical protein
VVVAGDHSNKKMETQRNSQGLCEPGDSANLIEVFREAELIQLECYYLEIHLYQLFFELVCSSVIV